MACWMCDGKGKWWAEDCGARIETAVEGHKVLHVEARGRFEHWNIITPINYCPFCGEKFKKGEEECQNEQ